MHALSLMAPTRLLAIAAIVVVSVLVLPPIWMLLWGSVSETNPDGSYGALTWAHYARLADNPRLWSSIVNSAVFAIGTTLFALLIGGSMAWLVARTDAPFQGLVYLTTIVSMATPYLLYVTAWLYLFGRAGPINALYRTLFSTEDILIRVNSMASMILIEGFLWMPLVFLLMTATFQNGNAELEEAARTSGASLGQTLRRISLRLALPAILALGLFVFVRSLESFEVPALVGLPGNISVLTSEIYVSMRKVPPDTGHASAFSVVLLAIVAVLLQLYAYFTRRTEAYGSITGKAFRPRTIALGRRRVLAGAYIILNCTIVIVLPLLALLWLALSPYPRPISIEGFSSLTIKQFGAIVHSTMYLEWSSHTIFLAALSATIVVAITGIAGWLAARRHPGGMLLDNLATLPVIFPGLVLGLAILQIFLVAPVPIYGTLWIILIAFVIRYLPYGQRYAFAGVLQIHRELEEAATVNGASTWLVLRRIIFPLLAPTIMSAWLFVFLLAARELSMVVLLASPSSETIAVAMLDLWTGGQSGELAAMGLIWTTLMTVIAAIFYALTRGRREILLS
jgi:iron(III) transport system permease protein